MSLNSKEDKLKTERAIILTNGMLGTEAAKTAHGLIRGGDRFDILAIIDPLNANRDAGKVLDGTFRNIPVHATIQRFLESGHGFPSFCIIGVALSGGRLPEEWNHLLVEALEKGISIINPMHQILGEIPEIKNAAKRGKATIIDIRSPRPINELHFWTGAIYEVKTPKIAVLGTDCAVGKRTTCFLVKDALAKKGVKAEMIYTGQTGWLLGNKFGFILDSTLNDFVSGEIEHAIVTCEQQACPSCILIEGQSSLRNPSGPCGSEILFSGNVKEVILQHAPFRRCFDTLEPAGCVIPGIEEEIEILRLFGARVIAITLNVGDAPLEKAIAYQQMLEQKTGIPVIRPLGEGMDRLTAIIQELIQNHK